MRAGIPLSLTATTRLVNTSRLSIKRIIQVVALFIVIVLYGEIFGHSAYSKELPSVFIQLGHSASVHSVAYSHNGRYLLSGSDDGTVKLWDAASGREIRTFPEHDTTTASVAFSPDDRYILSCSKGSVIKLFEVSTGKEVRTFAGHSAAVFTAAFSPNGKYILSGSNDTTLKLWDVNTGRNIQTFYGHSQSVNAVAYSPDGKYVLSGSDDDTLKLWDAATGKELKNLTGHTDHILSVAFSPDGKKALSGSRDNTMVLWELTSGQMQKIFPKQPGWVKSVVFSPDGKTAVSASFFNLTLWDVVSGKEIRTIQDFSGHESVALSPDSSYVLSGAGSPSNKLTLWNAATGEKVQTFEGHTNKVHSLAISPDGKYLLSGSHDETVKLWDTTTGRQIRNMHGDTGWVHSVAISPDSRYALSGGLHKHIDLWELATGKRIKTFTGHTTININSIAFSPDGALALSGGDDATVRLWDVKSGTELKIFYGHTERVFSVAFSSDGKKALSGGYDKAIKLWNIASGTEIKTFHAQDSVYSVAFSPDDNYVLANGWQTVRLWKISSGQEVQTFTGHSRVVNSAVFSPDGKYVLTGSDDTTVRLWDVASGAEIRTFHAQTADRITSVAFSRNGKLAFIGNTSGALVAFDVHSGREITSMIGFDNGEWISITPEGYYDSSENGDRYLNVRIGSEVYGIEQYREAFYRPELVKVSLSGSPLTTHTRLTEVQPPPRVFIVNTPTTINREDVTVTVKLVDIGGGIGDIRLYLNGSAIVLDKDRGLKAVLKDEKAIHKTYTIKLMPGLNILRATAFNAANTMQSSDTLHTITVLLQKPVKPSLYALIVGIQSFRNPKLNLAYSKADADLLASTLMNSASGMFDKVQVKKLTSNEETTRSSIISKLQSYRSLNPGDIFIFFVASHGTIDEGEYFLVTSNVGSTRTEKLRTDAISQAELKELLANIPATKKLILIDTCNAGALGDAIHVALLTRGMSEDTAMKVLSRAVGSTVLSASTSVQEALEGYQGHGLFSYVFAEGLMGKADKGKTGYIKTTDLADYVDNEVPALAEKVFKRAQYPTISINGQGFPIGTVK